MYKVQENCLRSKIKKKKEGEILFQCLVETIRLILLVNF